MKKFDLKKAIFGISFGLVFALALGFFYLRADSFFPTNTEKWKDYIETSLIFFTTIFTFLGPIFQYIDLELFQTSFIKETFNFIVFGILGFAGFYLLGIFTSSSVLPAIAQGISGISLGVIIFYIILVAYPEEMIFRSIVPVALKRTKLPIWFITLLSGIIFALYHAAIGRSWLTLLIYIPLHFLFIFIKIKFNPNSNGANAGVHAAWDLFITGFIS